MPTCNTAYHRLCKHLTGDSVAAGELGLPADAVRMIPSMDQHGHYNRFWRERGGNVKKRHGLLVAVFALRRQLTQRNPETYVALHQQQSGNLTDREKADVVVAIA